MSDVWLLRLGILVAGILLFAAMWYIGTRPRTGQGRRVEGRTPRDARMEPTLGAQLERELGDGGQAPGDATVQSEMELLDGAVGGTAGATVSEYGRRVSDEFDKIVTLYIAARAGQVLRGPDIVVAAEKAGLTYGHMNVFHRLVDGHPERGPVFSVANIRKPGSFEMAEIQALETPAIAFFLTLPAPLRALDAWDAMLPTAERMAELLDGVLLDEQRNALGRQRIAHLREELRGYDREQEVPITRSPGW
ncbi:cell division protein ZipA [Luteimonas sp. MC1825]|uniref:cell division protein ZipA n=1 Tax=Luteimonas sp. MC1825 TaxID=2761107 RepID=UPI0016070107|nr:cell division protein ZipA [Luteimonas sp. MC1825]MBB6599403.1 cell division protein ZipA [Luteimonas sp. MC1825]QOC87112.1 cell division protein ZipA [Luteimonas sp. MC1825]